MTPFAARCVLVGSALVLLAVGVLASSVPGGSRAALIGAAGCCAGLDVLVVRASRARERAGGAVLVGPLSDPGVAASVSDAGVTAPMADPGVARPVADAAEAVSPWAPREDGGSGATPVGERHPPDGGGAPDDVPPGILLGTGADGRTVTPDVGSQHLVVVGRGALAEAVFRGIALQLRDRAAGTGHRVRAAAATGLGPVLAGVVDAGADRPPMPEGTAAVVVLPARGAAPGRSDAFETVVLVPGSGSLPRCWDTAVEVTRYGCAVRFRGAARGTSVSPALPQLDRPQ